MSGNDPTLDACGCCQGVRALTPAAVTNAPGLSALAYRVGTHGTFKETMLAAIPGAPALAGLSTRDDDDPVISLADAWSTVLDVLTFYQERVANEGYLRTATERRSLLELAAAIGYRLNPGVAASTFLAFTLETAPGAAPTATIDVGVKVQSVPREKQLAQTFETVEPVVAYRDWSAIPARSTRFVPPAMDQTRVYLAGLATDLKPGDAVLLVGDERARDPANDNWDVRFVADVATEPAADRTVVTLDRGLGSHLPFSRPAAQNPRFYALRQRAACFGYNAPDWRAMSDNIRDSFLGWAPGTPVPVTVTQWPRFTLTEIADEPPGSIPGTGLEGEYFNDPNLATLALARTDPEVSFSWGTSTPDPLVTNPHYSARWEGWLNPVATGLHEFSVSTTGGVRLWIGGAVVIDQWGNTSLSDLTGIHFLAAGRKITIRLEYVNPAGSTSGGVRLSWSGPGLARQVVPTASLFPLDVYTLHLDAPYPKIQASPEGWAVLNCPGATELYRVEAAAADARADFTLTSKTTRLSLSGENFLEKFNGRVRETVVYAQSEPLAFAEEPITDPLAGDTIPLAGPVGDIPPGRLMVVSGKSAADGTDVSEVVTLDRVIDTADGPALHLIDRLVNAYDPATVVINANVARATHGETRAEVLGSGNGQVAFQPFTLKQKPLTYVSAATPAGAASTLAVRVNGLLWDEVPTLYGRAAGERVYVTRASDEGDVAIQFGDGKTGARVPTGTSNVAAQYRVGTGLAGMLDAGQLSLLLTRPLGVKGVVNPLPTTGAADPESPDDARRNAPLTVLTLDRIVSLQDYEDFARAFAGVGKSKATRVWRASRRSST
jgi:hypothetical protein